MVALHVYFLVLIVFQQEPGAMEATFWVLRIIIEMVELKQVFHLSFEFPLF